MKSTIQRESALKSDSHNNNTGLHAHTHKNISASTIYYIRKTCTCLFILDV